MQHLERHVEHIRVQRPLADGIVAPITEKFASFIGLVHMHILPTNKLASSLVNGSMYVHVYCHILCNEHTINFLMRSNRKDLEMYQYDAKILRILLLWHKGGLCMHGHTLKCKVQLLKPPLTL